MIESMLENLGLRDEEIRTFLFLLENGAQTAGNLAKKTGLSRPSLYGFMRKLQKLGLVIESQKNNVKTFSVSSKQKVSSLFNEKISELEKGRSVIEKAFAEIPKGVTASTPKFQIFEGKAGLTQVMEDMLLYRDITTKSYWPIKSMVEVLSAEYLSTHNKRRVKRNIYIEAIWPEKEKLDTNKFIFLGTGDRYLREVRIAPKNVNFSMGYWTYANKVIFLSSKKESYGFIIESKELVETMSSQFDVVWNMSKTIPANKKAEDEFFKEN